MSELTNISDRILLGISPWKNNEIIQKSNSDIKKS